MSQSGFTIRYPAPEETGAAIKSQRTHVHEWMMILTYLLADRMSTSPHEDKLNEYVYRWKSDLCYERESRREGLTRYDAFDAFASKRVGIPRRENAALLILSQSFPLSNWLTREEKGQRCTYAPATLLGPVAVQDLLETPLQDLFVNMRDIRCHAVIFHARAGACSSSSTTSTATTTTTTMASRLVARSLINANTANLLAKRAAQPFAVASVRRAHSDTVYVPGGPIYKGTVNDPTTFPPPNRVHGSYHWAFERILSASLVPLTAAAFVSSTTANPVLDGLLGIGLVIHSHIGFDSILVDYLHKRKFPILGPLLTWVLRATTAGVLVGVYQFNTNDIGLTEFVAKVWHA
ncbi:hypothetical protein NM688_g7437 [Phlebia brevispora]|uniref:Uncharacterized protein n=1 Tax=Phlebia brevispora TaxID=194682 RepID=A0ACC1S5B7_9APHY|nr:hypothetical protein NM688_g7437 [Phlebia brevispora]